MGDLYRMTIIVSDPYTPWYSANNPYAVSDAFAELQASDLAMDIGNDGETPTFGIVTFESIEALEGTDDE